METFAFVEFLCPEAEVTFNFLASLINGNDKPHDGDYLSHDVF